MCLIVTTTSAISAMKQCRQPKNGFDKNISETKPTTNHDNKQYNKKSIIHVQIDEQQLFAYMVER